MNAGAILDADGRFFAAGFPLLQGSQALALVAADAAVAWIGLAVVAACSVILTPAMPVDPPRWGHTGASA